MVACELKNITFAYPGEQNVLENASLGVNYGELVLISGFSGCGKSTLLSILSGIIPNLITGKISGDVLINGTSVAGKPIREISHNVGIVLQDAEAQIIHETIEDEIAFGCENFAFPSDEITSAINYACNKMNLNKDDKTKTLSGGEKQRLMSGCALATGQRILILDEPLANLDKKSGTILLNTLRELTNDGYAVIICEHRLDVIMPYADTVYEISDKKINKIHDKASYLKSMGNIIPDILNPFVNDNNTIDENKNHKPTALETLQKLNTKNKNNDILSDTGLHAENKYIYEIKDLKFTVKSREIIRGIHYNIEAGKRLLILGDNGSGKTTFIRLLCGLYKPTSGEIISHRETKTEGDKFADIGLVYQNPNYQLFMPTVYSEIDFNSVSHEYTDEMIELFGLKNLIKKHPQSLSEGQKRRLSIACVLAKKPKILFLDEPTVGQDYNGLLSLTEILNNIHRETNNTMITISHDIRCMNALCDDAIIIDKGMIIEHGDKSLIQKYINTAQR